MKRGVSIGIPAALLLAGIMILAGVLAAHRTASRADHWTQARATIERVDGAKVTYRYEAGGRAHRSTGTARPNDRYAGGSSVLVYVNPSAPSESLLQLPRRPPMWPLLAGVLALIAGGGLGVYAWLEARKKPVATPVRKPAPPLSRLRPPPPVKRT